MLYNTKSCLKFLIAFHIFVLQEKLRSQSTKSSQSLLYTEYLVAQIFSSDLSKLRSYILGKSSLLS